MGLEAAAGPAAITAGPHRTTLTVRGSLRDDDLELVLLAAATLWE